ncbi:ABC transporter ATP-binding protein [Salinarchaeum chitinilyticum]
MAAIDIKALQKRYGDVVAVDDLDLTVEDGEIYGFLGPNGAGKSTTIDCLLGYATPTSGEIEVLGRNAIDDSVALRQQVGVLPEDLSMYDRLTARKHVQFAIDVKDVDDDPEALLERVGLQDAIDRKAGGFSTGMAQRLALAMALVGKPDLLVLDEPTSGLDPNGARELREIIREENERGATVFFSSHIMEQVEAVCDRVGIMKAGKMVAEDDVAGLRENAGGGSTLIVTLGGSADGVAATLRDRDDVQSVRADGNSLSVSLEKGARKTAIIGAIEEDGYEIDDFRTEEASLEDIFASYTEGAA